MATNKVDQEQIEAVENYFVGKDEEAHASNLFTLQLSTPDVLAIVEFETRKRSVEDYIIEFYQLLARKEIQETEE